MFHVCACCTNDIVPLFAPAISHMVCYACHFHMDFWWAWPDRTQLFAWMRCIIVWARTPEVLECRCQPVAYTHEKLKKLHPPNIPQQPDVFLVVAVVYEAEYACALETSWPCHSRFRRRIGEIERKREREREIAKLAGVEQPFLRRRHGAEHVMYWKRIYKKNSRSHHCSSIIKAGTRMMWFTLLCFCSMSRNNLEMGSGQTFMLLKHFTCRLRQHWPAMGCWSCSSVGPCACGATWSGRSVQVWGRQQVGITRCHLVVTCFLMDRQHDEIVSHFQHSWGVWVVGATEPEGTSPTQSSFRRVGGPTVRQPRVWKSKLYRL